MLMKFSFSCCEIFRLFHKLLQFEAGSHVALLVQFSLVCLPMIYVLFVNYILSYADDAVIYTRFQGRRSSEQRADCSM